MGRLCRSRADVGRVRPTRPPGGTPCTAALTLVRRRHLRPPHREEGSDDATTFYAEAVDQCDWRSVYTDPDELTAEDWIEDYPEVMASRLFTRGTSGWEASLRRRLDLDEALVLLTLHGQVVHVRWEVPVHEAIATYGAIEDDAADDLSRSLVYSARHATRGILVGGSHLALPTLLNERWWFQAFTGLSSDIVNAPPLLRQRQGPSADRRTLREAARGVPHRVLRPQGPRRRLVGSSHGLDEPAGEPGNTAGAAATPRPSLKQPPRRAAEHRWRGSLCERTRTSPRTVPDASRRAATRHRHGPTPIGLRLASLPTHPDSASPLRGTFGLRIGRDASISRRIVLSSAGWRTTSSSPGWCGSRTR